MKPNSERIRKFVSNSLSFVKDSSEIRMKIKKGDKVLIVSGKDKGKIGNVLKSFPKEKRVLVEAVNLKQKHIKPKKQGEKGQVVKIPASIDTSNAKFICPKCGKATRLGYKIVPTESRILDGKAVGKKERKFRICKKCQSEV